MAPSRAAQRPTRALGPWEGVRPPPGAGQIQHYFFSSVPSLRWAPDAQVLELRFYATLG